MDKIQIILCIDECKSNNPQTLGCLTMPVKTFKQVEAEVLNHRLETNLWGELKYKAINDSYLSKYQEFIDLFLSKRAVTFHSWSFDSKFKHLDPSVSPNDLLYRNTYMLIRSVITKYQRYVIKNHLGIRLEFIIMIDESGDKGLSSAKQFQEYLAIDNAIINTITEFRFLSTCNSTINNSMQAVDILTGLTASYYSGDALIEPKIKLRDHISKSYNNGVMMHKIRSRSIPELFDYKIHAYLLSRNPQHTQASSLSIT